MRHGARQTPPHHCEWRAVPSSQAVAPYFSHAIDRPNVLRVRRRWGQRGARRAERQLLPLPQRQGPRSLMLLR
ncbi:hypothetical protein TZ00_12560 [Agreia bicolorata]|uniref:Uncharacterized protein n=1 Tax=Agreia bicolorata TaxID=110935 RepID=A0ABR5CDZ3_9MICO|nr:hypothetical protein TZ00_12560 [Agreia bicolorata]